MSKWTVGKLVKPNGNIPYDKWQHGLSVGDRARVDDAILSIEGVTQIPPERVKKYGELFELKIYGKGVAHRPLAIKDGQNRLIVLLVGTTKKGRIADGDYKRALALAKSFNDGECSVQGYWED